MDDGRIITGKTSDLLGAAAACLMNVLKEYAGIPHEEKLVSAESIMPIQRLKTEYLGAGNPRLHTDELLVALSMSAATNPHAELAIEQLPKLRGSSCRSFAARRRILRLFSRMWTCRHSGNSGFS